MKLSQNLLLQLISECSDMYIFEKIFWIIIQFLFVWSDLIWIHTYIMNHYNPSVGITAQLFTPLMLCDLILYMSGGSYSLTSTPNDKFLRNFFMAGLLFSELLPEICWDFHISFWCLAWDANPGFVANKTTHYLLDYNDFLIQSIWNFKFKFFLVCDGDRWNFMRRNESHENLWCNYVDCYTKINLMMIPDRANSLPYWMLL